MPKSINAIFTADFSQFERAIDQVVAVRIKAFEKGAEDCQTGPDIAP